MKAHRQMHGLSCEPNGKRTRMHALWLNIRNKCNNPRTNDYKYYGARGIKVCERWNRYVVFLADIGPHPGPGWTLDRIDVNGNYEPSNVRWATRQTQSRNRTYCWLDKETADKIRAEYVRGVTRQVDLAKKYGIHQSQVSAIIRGASWV